MYWLQVYADEDLWTELSAILISLFINHDDDSFIDKHRGRQLRPDKFVSPVFKKKFV